MSDVVREAAGEGSDAVYASVNYTLAAGQHVEELRANDDAALTLTGNAYDNAIYGGIGADSLNGGAGNDTLDSGAGSDTLKGGTGDDVYYVDLAGDQVIEAADGGTDTVWASIDYALAEEQEAEILRAGVTAAMELTGNELNNAIFGNAGNDVLCGDTGNDALNGGARNDVFAFARGDGNDTVQASSTNGQKDTIRFDDGIAYNQLWFRHEDNDLQISVIGQSQVITVEGWYDSASTKRVDKLVAGNRTLEDADVEQLVQAMSAFTAPSSTSTPLPSAVRQQVDSYWHIA